MRQAENNKGSGCPTKPQEADLAFIFRHYKGMLAKVIPGNPLQTEQQQRAKTTHHLSHAFDLLRSLKTPVCSCIEWQEIQLLGRKEYPFLSCFRQLL